MSWVPTTDFQEELCLQPHHDQDYRNLWEPHCSYPRPKAHTEYAANRKLHNKDQQKESQISPQMKRMEGIKSPGQKETFIDCENINKTEQEIIGMMRYCGIGTSDDQPLDKTVTIATSPVENSIKVVKNGRRTVALFFDENVFKLKTKRSVQ